MEELRDRLERSFESWGRIIIRRRWLTIALMTGLALVPGSQLSKLDIDSSTER